jgi:hypothetical protein
MISHIANIEKIQQLLQKSNTMEFNNTLPVVIQILKKTRSLHYLLQLGHQKLETKSLQELHVGERYWAEMRSRPDTHSILISNLIKQPKMVLDFPLFTLDSEHISHLLNQEKNPIETMKNFLVERLSVATDKNEFSFLSHLLLSLQHHILTFPFQFQDRFGYAQLRAHKPTQTEQKKLEFYACFQNLGPLKGMILEVDHDSLGLSLWTPFVSTKHFLEKELDMLHGFSDVAVLIDKEIHPLYVMSHSLLDITG